MPTKSIRNRAAEDDHEEDEDEHVGDRHQHVHDAHHHRVEAAPEVARGRPVRGADDDRDEGAHDADHQGDPGSLHGAREEVAAELVHPEPVAVRERGRPRLRDAPEHRPVDLLVGPGRDEVPEQGEGGDETEHREARDRGAVAEKARAGVLPERTAGGGAGAPAAARVRSRARAQARRPSRRPSAPRRGSGR